MSRFSNKNFLNKPIVGSRINWKNPLSKGLYGCWLFNEGAGGIAIDLAKRAGNATNNNNMPFNVSPYGKCILGDDTSSSNKYFYSIPNILSGDVTVFVIAMRNKDVATLSGGRDELDSMVATKFNANGWTFIMGDNFLAVGSKNKVELSTDGTGQGLFINGIKQASTTISDAELTTGIYYRMAFKATGTGVGINHRIANGSDINNYFFNGNIILVYEWSRILSDNEIYYITKYPYIFINQPRRFTYDFPASVSSTISSVQIERHMPRGAFRGVIRGAV